MKIAFDVMTLMKRFYDVPKNSVHEYRKKRLLDNDKRMWRIGLALLGLAHT